MRTVPQNHHSFSASLRLSFPFKLTVERPAPPRLFANVRRSAPAGPGPTFDSDLRPECDDKRPWTIMDEAELGEGETQGPAIRLAAAAITQPVRGPAERQPWGVGRGEPPGAGWALRESGATGPGHPCGRTQRHLGEGRGGGPGVGGSVSGGARWAVGALEPSSGPCTVTGEVRRL